MVAETSVERQREPAVLRILCVNPTAYRLNGDVQMTASENVIDEVRTRLKVRADTFLDSDGEELFAKLKQLASHNHDAAAAISEIEHRRSEKVE